MKQWLKISAYAALAIISLTLSGCKDVIDENVILPSEGSGKMMSFNALSDADEAQRSQLHEDGENVVWSGDEKMGVFYTTQESGASNVERNRNACYTLSSLSEDSKQATFAGDIEWVEMEGTHKFQIYYPYNEEVTSSSAAFGTLPTEQVYNPDGWNISDYDFMVSGTASTTEVGATLNVTFKHLFSILRLNITNGTSQELNIEKVRLTSKSGLILAGDFQANIGKSKTNEALHNATEVSNTDGHFTNPSSTVLTTITEGKGEVKAGEAFDVRLMINAGLKDGSTEEYYLDGETFEVEIYTTGNPVWKTEFVAGKLARGARVAKKLTLDEFDSNALTVSKITPNYDATSDRFYLNTIATATGVSLDSVVKLTVDGKEVPANGLAVESTQIRFRIPDTIEGHTAKECTVLGYDSDNKSYELGKIKVYPFFYYKDIQLGLGTNSNKTFSDDAAQKSYFIPDLGRVISAAEWYNTPIDSFVVNANEDTNATATAALSAKNKLNKTNITATQYYESMPYYFLISYGSGQTLMPAASNGDKLHGYHYVRNDEGKWSLLVDKNKTLYGTPILRFMPLSSEQQLSQQVKAGTLESFANITAPTDATGTALAWSGQITFGTSTVDAGTWTKGAVIMTGYISYKKGGTSNKLTDYAKLGFFHITDVTCADPTTGNASTDGSIREGYVTFDFYWSKPINDTESQPLYGDDNGEALTPSVPTTPPTGDDEEGDDTEDGEHTAGTYTVSSVAELTELMPLKDGDVIVWSNGTYNNVNITLTGEENITNGITFRAESNGGVVFTGNSTLLVKSSKTTVKGFRWQDPVLDEGSEHLVRFYTGTSNCTLTECAISGSNTTADYERACKWVSLSGSNHTVENCSFIDKKDRGALLVVWFDEEVEPSHTIQNNYFTRPTILIDPTDGDPANEQETLRIGDSANSLSDGGCIVKGNHFYKCYGESAEVISNKSCANTYTGNYLEECRGTLTLRHGNNCLVEGNYFYGNGVEESGGVRVIGENHIVRGNHFEKLTGIGYKAALSLVRGQENAALSGYAQVKNALIEDNIFTENTLAMHVNYGGSNMTLPVVSTTIRNNTLVSTSTSDYIVRYETSTPEAEITWEDNTLYGRFKNNYFSLSAVKTAPTLEDVTAKRTAIANGAGTTTWSIE